MIKQPRSNQGVTEEQPRTRTRSKVYQSLSKMRINCMGHIGNRIIRGKIEIGCDTRSRIISREVG